MIRFLYRIYQLFVALPVMLVFSALTSIVTIIGCTLGSAHFWGYYPAMIWSRLMCYVFLLPVRVEGRKHLAKHQSYVFVANHQGPFDIFLVYGFLGRNFKWMMKKSLRHLFLIGKACESAGHIFVDKSGPRAIQQTYRQGREVLRHGTSLVVFPEGARTFTGHMGVFRRGAFMLADELQLPVVPLTINGSFNVMPRTKDWHFVTWHPLRLTIHQPVYPVGQGPQNIQAVMRQSYDSVMSALEEKYQGYMENPDQ